MKMTHSYMAKIINVNDSINDTILIYRKALAYIINVVDLNWANFDNKKSKDQINYCEKLIHKTNDNPTPLYEEFDDLFYKYPSYLRRSTIQAAIGKVSSYRSNLENWNEDRKEAYSKGIKFKKGRPKLRLKHYDCPVLYSGNMFINLYENNMFSIKIYKINEKNKTSDWIWFNVKLRGQDLKYIERNTAGMKKQSPTLVKDGKKYYIKFPFKHEVKLSNKKIKDRKVCAVDLGINHSAVCSVINYDGTVSDRIFINQKLEKDRQNWTMNNLKETQRQNGNQKTPKIWAKIKSYNEYLINDTINQIIKFSLKNKVDVIVCEYLNFKGKKHNKNMAMKLHMWKCRTIIKKIEHTAHKCGMRFSRVNARNTSALAFDGSGPIKRNKKNASLCVFPSGITPKGNLSYRNGKQYNSDLNASYNIGARYFIRAIVDDCSEKKKNQFEAKVPGIGLRTQRTLSMLRLIVA